jgi:hypothetical protein
MPASELPKERGNTRAQEVWNAIALGEELHAPKQVCLLRRELLIRHDSGRM